MGRCLAKYAKRHVTTPKGPSKEAVLCPTVTRMGSPLFDLIDTFLPMENYCLVTSQEHTTGCHRAFRKHSGNYCNYYIVGSGTCKLAVNHRSAASDHF